MRWTATIVVKFDSPDKENARVVGDCIARDAVKAWAAELVAVEVDEAPAP